MNLSTRMNRARTRMTGQHRIAASEPIHVGVDLGTAFTVVMVTDTDGKPLCGATTYADVVRDGLVWDFAGATNVLRTLKEDVEKRTGRSLQHAAVTIPPAVSESDHRAHRYVLESVGFECDAVVDEPTAANTVLGLRDGAVVDIGGGTTGIALIRDGKVESTLDEPSGGTHLSLVIAGALKIPFEEAEAMKRDEANHPRLLPIVTPVLEKISTIVRDGIRGKGVENIYIVGGTGAFNGVDSIMTRITGVESHVAPHPMYVTPLGVAGFATVEQGES